MIDERQRQELSAKRLGQLIGDSGIRQKMLAQYVGTTPGTISSWVNSKNEYVHPTVLFNTASYFEVEPVWLYGLGTRRENGIADEYTTLPYLNKVPLFARSTRRVGLDELSRIGIEGLEQFKHLALYNVQSNRHGPGIHQNDELIVRMFKPYTNYEGNGVELDTYKPSHGEVLLVERGRDLVIVRIEIDWEGNVLVTEGMSAEPNKLTLDQFENDVQVIAVVLSRSGTNF